MRQLQPLQKSTFSNNDNCANNFKSETLIKHMNNQSSGVYSEEDFPGITSITIRRSDNSASDIITKSKSQTQRCSPDRTLLHIEENDGSQRFIVDMMQPVQTTIDEIGVATDELNSKESSKRIQSYRTGGTAHNSNKYVSRVSSSGDKASKGRKATISKQYEAALIDRLSGATKCQHAQRSNRNSHVKPIKSITEVSSSLTSRRATVQHQQPSNTARKSSLTVPSEPSQGKKSCTPKKRTLQPVETEKQLFELENYIKLVQPLATQTSIERIDKQRVLDLERRVTELEELLSEERDTVLEGQMRIRQLLEIVKLKNLHIKELEVQLMIEQERNKGIVNCQSNQRLHTLGSGASSARLEDGEQVAERHGLCQLGHEVEQELLKEIQEECDRLEEDHEDSRIRIDYDSKADALKQEEMQRDAYMLEDCLTERNSEVAAQMVSETTRKHRPLNSLAQTHDARVVLDQHSFQNVNFNTYECEEAQMQTTIEIDDMCVMPPQIIKQQHEDASICISQSTAQNQLTMTMGHASDIRRLMESTINSQQHVGSAAQSITPTSQTQASTSQGRSKNGNSRVVKRSAQQSEATQERVGSDSVTRPNVTDGQRARSASEDRVSASRRTPVTRQSVAQPYTRVPLTTRGPVKASQKTTGNRSLVRCLKGNRDRNTTPLNVTAAGNNTYLSAIQQQYVSKAKGSTAGLSHSSRTGGLKSPEGPSSAGKTRHQMTFFSEANAQDESAQKTQSADLCCPVATQATVSENTKQSFHSSHQTNVILTSTLPLPKETLDQSHNSKSKQDHDSAHVSRKSIVAKPSPKERTAAQKPTNLKKGWTETALKERTAGIPKALARRSAQKEQRCKPSTIKPDFTMSCPQTLHTARNHLARGRPSFTLPSPTAAQNAPVTPRPGWCAHLGKITPLSAKQEPPLATARANVGPMHSARSGFTAVRKPSAPRSRNPGPSAFNITNQAAGVTNSQTKSKSTTSAAEKKKKRAAEAPASKKTATRQPQTALTLPGLLNTNRRGGQRNEVLFQQVLQTTRSRERQQAGTRSSHQPNSGTPVTLGPEAPHKTTLHHVNGSISSVEAGAQQSAIQSGQSSQMNYQTRRARELREQNADAQSAKTDEIKQAVERDLLEVSGRKRDLHRRADTTLTNGEDALVRAKQTLLTVQPAYASSSCNGTAPAVNTALIKKQAGLQPDEIALSRNQQERGPVAEDGLLQCTFDQSSVAQTLTAAPTRHDVSKYTSGGGQVPGMAVGYACASNNNTSSWMCNYRSKDGAASSPSRSHLTNEPLQQQIHQSSIPSQTMAPQSIYNGKNIVDHTIEQFGARVKASDGQYCSVPDNIEQRSQLDVTQGNSLRLNPLASCQLAPDAAEEQSGVVDKQQFDFDILSPFDVCELQALTNNSATPPGHDSTKHPPILDAVYMLQPQTSAHSLHSISDSSFAPRSNDYKSMPDHMRPPMRSGTLGGEFEIIYERTSVEEGDPSQVGGVANTARNLGTGTQNTLTDRLVLTDNADGQEADHADLGGDDLDARSRRSLFEKHRMSQPTSNNGRTAQTPGAHYGCGADHGHVRVSQEESSEILSLNVADSMSQMAATQVILPVAALRDSPRTSPCRKRLAALSSLLGEHANIGHPAGPTIEVSTTERKLRRALAHGSTPSQQLILEQKMSDRCKRDSLLPPSEGARRHNDPLHDSPSLLQDANSPSAAIEDNNEPTPVSNDAHEVAHTMGHSHESPCVTTLYQHYSPSVNAGQLPSRFSLELRGSAGDENGVRVDNSSTEKSPVAMGSGMRHRRSRRDRSSHSKSRDMHVLPSLINPIAMTMLISDNSATCIKTANGTPSPLANNDLQGRYDAPQKKRVIPFIDQIAGSMELAATRNATRTGSSFTGCNNHVENTWVAPSQMMSASNTCEMCIDNSESMHRRTRNVEAGVGATYSQDFSYPEQERGRSRATTGHDFFNAKKLSTGGSGGTEEELPPAKRSTNRRDELSERAEEDEAEDVGAHSQSLSKYCREFNEAEEDAGGTVHSGEAGTNQQPHHHEKTSSSHSIAQFERRQSQNFTGAAENQLVQKDVTHMVDNVHAVMRDNRRLIYQSFAVPSHVASPNTAKKSARKSERASQPAASAQKSRRSSMLGRGYHTNACSSISLIKSSADYGHGMLEMPDQRSLQHMPSHNGQPQKYFKLHNDSLYAYNGAFDTFNQYLARSQQHHSSESSVGRNEHFIHGKKVRMSALFNQIPGNVFLLVASFLGEKLPALAFANRSGFKAHLGAMLDDYQQRRNFVRHCLRDGVSRGSTSSRDFDEDIEELRTMEKIYDGIVENIAEFANIVR